MKKISLIGVSIALLFLTSCITIFEKYTINANGSGTMEYLVDLSKMYEIMASLTDSVEDVQTDEIDKSWREALPQLNSIEGISNVQLSGDPAKYIAGIKFDFKNVQALNKALAIVLEGDETEKKDIQYVAIKGKTFTRFSTTSKEFNKEELLGSEGLDEETTRMMLADMKYKISVNFEKKVKKVTTSSTYTKDDHTVNIEASFSDLFDNADFLKTVIKTR